MPTDPTAAIVLLVLIALISVVRNIIEIIVSFRRKPSIDRDLQDYMPRTEITAHLDDLKSEDKRIWQVIEATDRTINKELKDVNRALGRIEGFIEKLEENL